MRWLIADAGGTDWRGLLNQYGFPIALIGMIIVGRFVPGFLHERVWKESQAKDAELDRLHRQAEEKVIPALVESTQVLRDAMQLIRDQEADRRADARARAEERVLRAEDGG